MKTKKQDDLKTATEQNFKHKTKDNLKAGNDPDEIDLMGSGDETKNIVAVSVMKASNEVSSAAACTPLGMAGCGVATGVFGTTEKEF